MKTRVSFVSNSSSSSYVISLRDGSTADDAERSLLEHFGVPESSLLYDFAKAAARRLAHESFEKIGNHVDLFRELWYNGPEDVDPGSLGEWMLNQINGGAILLVGSVSNESIDPSEFWLVDVEIDYDDGKVAVKKEAGF